MDNLADLLFALRNKGVRLWADNGRLRYEARKGALNAAEMATLRARKDEILRGFTASVPAAAPLQPRAKAERVGLTFSQVRWWNNYGLATRPSSRTLASAVRLKGRLSYSSLQEAFAGLVRRHESLRAQIVNRGSVAEQVIAPTQEVRLEIIDIARLPEAEREIEATRLAQELIYAELSVATDPLWAARLLRLTQREHVLVIALDHMISDAASLGIVWRDLLQLYAEAERGVTTSLSPVPIQFADYAVWQEKSNDSWVKQHEAYWGERLAGGCPTRVFYGHSPLSTYAKKWSRLPVRFGEELTLRLRELSQRERTTLVMSVLTAFVATVRQWSGRADLIVPLISLGRQDTLVEKTVGFFGSQLFLRIEVPEGITYRSLLERVSAEFAAAWEHNDFGRMAAQLPEPLFLRNPAFNWIPQELDMNPTGSMQGAGVGEVITVERFPVEILPRDDFEWDGEFMALLSDTADGVSGSIAFRADRIAHDAIECFVSDLRAVATRLVNEPMGHAAAGRFKTRS